MIAKLKQTIPIGITFVVFLLSKIFINDSSNPIRNILLAAAIGALFGAIIEIVRQFKYLSGRILGVVALVLLSSFALLGVTISSSKAQNVMVAVPATCLNRLEGEAGWVEFKTIFSGRAEGREYFSGLYSIYCTPEKCVGTYGSIQDGSIKMLSPMDGVTFEKTASQIYTFKWGMYHTFVADFTRHQLRLIENVDVENHTLDVTVSCVESI